MTEGLDVMPVHGFPTGISIVHIDRKELREAYGVSDIGVNFLDQEGVQKINRTFVDHAKKSFRELLSNPENTENPVSIPVSPIGSMPALTQILQELREENTQGKQPNVDLTRLDFVYAIAQGEWGEKSMRFWRVTDKGPKELSDDEIIQSPSILIEDIFDSLETYELTLKKFPKLVGIGPIGKGPGDTYLSTMQNYKKRFGSMDENKPYLRVVKPNEPVDLLTQGINIFGMAEYRWIKSGFGMDGNTQDIRALAHPERAIFEVLERHCSICIYNEGIDPIDLDKYKQGLIKHSRIDLESDYFDRMVSCVVRNNQRKESLKGSFREQAKLFEMGLVEDANSLLNDVKDGRLSVQFRQAA